MFDDLLQKKLEINFYNDKNCNVFEISNFLSPKQYQSILENIPSIDKLKASRINPVFDDKTNQHQLKAFITVLQKEAYNEYMLKNPILNEFIETFKKPAFNSFILKKLYFRILKSRIFDLKNFIKLLIRKNNFVGTKNNNFFHKIFFNDIVTTVEFSVLFNGAESFPHTDGMKKILSLMLYFPDDSLSDMEIKSLGTTFYNSNEFSLTQLEKSKVDTHDKSKSFKKKNIKKTTLPFKKYNLYGFVKSHKSWHSVEPININDDFTRKSFNINLLLV